MNHRNTESDFWARVTIGSPDECWEWQEQSRVPQGYGMTNWQNHQIRAHRLAWLLTYGDPGDLWVLHRCDNPPCCNPAHLFLGTAADNAADRDAKSRGARLFGENNPRARITSQDVQRMRQLRAEGALLRELADLFGVDRRQVGRIVRRERWGHLV